MCQLRFGWKYESGNCSHEVWEHHTVLEGVGDPDQVQWILIDADLFGEKCRVVRAEVTSSVGLYAEAEVSYSDLKICSPDDVAECCCDAWVDLCWVVGRCVLFVVEGYEEDVRYRG